ncbi:MAG: hypothetical protein MK137_09625 [Rickettsiales bacterium]|nr:hypothetical protein [Rickettsiales bacterium]
MIEYEFTYDRLLYTNTSNIKYTRYNLTNIGDEVAIILNPDSPRFCCYFLFHPLDSRSKVQE